MNYVLVKRTLVNGEFVTNYLSRSDDSDGLWQDAVNLSRWALEQGQMAYYYVLSARAYKESKDVR